jgi:hypothetical protein
MLEEFDAKHGGGVLMLGGVNSFNVGGYAGTPVAKMLPVELAGPTVPYDHREFHVKVAEKGVTHPIMHQADDAVSNVNIWNTVSPLLGHNPVKGLKPGAVALLESVDTHEPILAVQNYGAGRTAAFTTGGSWFWRMDREIGDKLHERFWRQLIRWLSVGAQTAVLAVARMRRAGLGSRRAVVTNTSSIHSSPVMSIEHRPANQPECLSCEPWAMWRARAKGKTRMANRFVAPCFTNFVMSRRRGLGSCWMWMTRPLIHTSPPGNSVSQFSHARPALGTSNRWRR